MTHITVSIIAEHREWAGNTYAVPQNTCIYIEHHSVCPLVGIGNPPTPLLAIECALPTRTKGGGAHSPAAKGVYGGVPIPTIGEKLSTLATLCIWNTT